MADNAEEVRATERWFIRRGLPMFVEQYTAAEDVFTRAYPLLLLVFAITLTSSFEIEAETWLDVVVVLALVVIVLALVVVPNKRRGRRALQRAHVSTAELVVFVLLPPLVALIAGGWRNALGSLAVTSGTLLLIYVVTRYALLAALEWATSRVVRQIGDVYRLVTRALPLLLLFITFLFINAEVWQMAGSLEAPVLWGTIAFFAALGISFLVVRLPEERDRIESEVTRGSVVDACRGTPLETVVHTLPDLDTPRPLQRRQERNLVLVLLFTQLVQVTLLAASVWVFFLLFGAVAIEVPVQAAWIGAEPDVLLALGDERALSRELLRVATFLAGFAGLYFTVYAVTDTTYRSQFFGEVLADLGRVVGVRRAYLALRQGSLQDAPQTGERSTGRSVAADA